MKLCELIAIRLKVEAEHGSDLSVVSHSLFNPDHSDCFEYDDFAKAQVYVGFTSGKQIRSSPQNPLTDKPVLVIE